MSGTYVLVTAAKDAASTIGETVRCVKAQTQLPLSWVIVDDGSTDDTAAIIDSERRETSWITLLRRTPGNPPSFASVVEAIQAGIGELAELRYDYLGLLDSDLSFQGNYFKTLIGRFEERPRLGLAGGCVVDPAESKTDRPRNCADVPGATQLFRRSCLDAVGPLVPVPDGGWDALTCAAARKQGYETALMTDLVVDHLKPRNIMYGGGLRRHWQLGRRDQALGYGILFATAKWLARAMHPRQTARSLAALCGYSMAALSGRPPVPSRELLDHIRKEQRDRLLTLARPRRAAGSRSRR